MRRSNSLLNNIAAENGEVREHFRPPNGYPAQGMNPHYGQPQMGATPPHYHSGPPAGHYNVPPAQDAAAMEKLQHAQAKLESLVSKIGNIAVAQEQRITAAEAGSLNSNARDIASIEAMIGKLHQDIDKRLGEQTDPQAYAQVVEASHANVLAEIQNIHAAVEQAGHSNSDLASRVDMLSTRLGELDRTEEKAEIFALRQELASLADMISNRDTVPAEASLDTTGIHERLEEITRAILALSGADSGLDNLERLEARVIELSRAMAEQKSSPAVPAAIDATQLNPFFDETRSALAALDQRLSEFSLSNASTPADQGLMDEVRSLSERVANLSAAFTGSSDEMTSADPELLGRLDAIVERVERLSGDSGMDQAWQMRLETQLGEIAGQLNQSGAAVGFAQTDFAAGGTEAVNRLESLVQRLESLESQGTETASTDLLGSLETQMSAIMEKLSDGSGAGQSFEPITARLDSIEQQIGSSRDIGIEMAACAAEDAVRKVLSDPSSGAAAVSPEVLQGLWDDIRKLGENGVTAQNPANEAMVDTLGQIAERLQSLEENLRMHSSQHDAHGAVYAEAPTAGEMATGFVPETQSISEYAADAANFTSDAISEQLETPYEPAAHEPVAHEEVQPSAPEVAEPVRELSAGESLVRAARDAELERQRSQAMHEIQSSSGGVRDEREFDAELPGMRQGVEQQTQSQSEQVVPDIIEPPVQPQYQSTAAHMTEPMANPEEEQLQAGDDLPMEPGSGGPDLAALVRQANQRRKAMSANGEGTSGTDFLAAARRAAQAAAKEASELETEQEEAKQSSGLMNAISGIWGKRKNKAVVAAVSALVLTTIAVPVVTSFATGSSDDVIIETTAAIPDTATPPETQAFPDTVATDADNSLVQDQPIADPVIVDTELADTDEDVTEVDSFVTNSVVAAGDDADRNIINVVDMSELAGLPDALKQAIGESDPLAIFEVGRRFTNGEGVEKNLEAASRYYEQSAKLGYVPAQYVIGNFHEKGVGVTSDRTMAQAWYEQAADAGHIVAMHNLGVMYATADPTTGKPDLSKAFKWFGKAAEYGVKDSQVNLGIFHAKGMAGEADLVEAYKWLAIAAQSGDQDAASKRELIAKSLSAELLSDAKNRVSGWKQKDILTAANDVQIPDEWRTDTATASVLDDAASIALAQELLGKVGFDVGPADGVMGARTKGAIQAFRAKTGLQAGDKIDQELIETLKAVAI